MPLTFAQKVLARASGAGEVAPGAIVEAYPDLVMSNTATWRSIRQFERVRAERLWDPDRLAFVLDHTALPRTAADASNQSRVGTFAELQGAQKLYDITRGTPPRVQLERGPDPPGQVGNGT